MVNKLFYSWHFSMCAWNLNTFLLFELAEIMDTLEICGLG